MTHHTVQHGTATMEKGLSASPARVFAAGRYHDIVPDKRIVYTEIIASMEATEGACLVSVEFLPDGEGTRLVITLQTVALDGSALLEEAQAGWGSALIRLEELLQAG